MRLVCQAVFLDTTFSWNDVLIVAAWGVRGLLLAMRFLRLGTTSRMR